MTVRRGADAGWRDVLVAPDRAGAHFISLRGLHDVILMDDGMQTHLSKNILNWHFDGSVGIGNGFLIPTGRAGIAGIWRATNGYRPDQWR